MTTPAPGEGSPSRAGEAPLRGADKTPHGNETARSSGVRIALAAAAAFFFCAFVSLGTWQVKRLQWKEDLIARVDARVHAEPVPAPRAAEWPRVSAASHEYRRVRVSGTLLYDLTTRVQTTTALGIGFWLMTPLCTEDGIVLVNRGFVPMKSGDLELPAPPKASGDVCGAARRLNPKSQPLGSGRSTGLQAGTAAQAESDALRNPCCAPAGLTQAVASWGEITGLLRLTEPKGRVLRENDPKADRWYTRDIAAIAAQRGLSHVAPYFVDAEQGQEHPRGNEPVTGGLTVIAFPNNHLTYALTWFALAAMVAGGYYLVLRHERRRATGEMDDAGD